MREGRSRGPLQVNTTTNEEAVFDGKETLAKHSKQLGLGIGHAYTAIGANTTHEDVQTGSWVNVRASGSGKHDDDRR